MGHRIWHPAAAVLFFSLDQFLGGVLSSQIEEHLRKKAVHLYRSTRPLGYQEGHVLRTFVLNLLKRGIPEKKMNCTPRYRSSRLLHTVDVQTR